MKLKDNFKYSGDKYLELNSSRIFKLLEYKTIDELFKENIIILPDKSNNISLNDSDMLFLKRTNEISTTNIIGTLNYQEENLQISSRFDKDNNYFLRYMLEKVFNCNLVSYDANFSLNKDLFNLLPMLFIQRLNKAMIKGVFKEYKTKKYNNVRFSGTLDVSRHIKNNYPFKGNIAYKKREYSYDNDITQLIRHTIELLRKNKEFEKRLSVNVTTRENIKRIIDSTTSYHKADLQIIVNRNTMYKISHKYYIEYRDLQEICLLIIFNFGVSFFNENKEKYKINGMLIDASWLFEEYIAIVLGGKYIHPQNKTKKYKQYFFSGTKRAGEIYPDFISKNGEKRVVLDAKYKKIDTIRSQDYSQLLAYMFRFSANRGYYIYPYNGSYSGNEEKKYNLLNGIDYGVDRSTLQSDIEVIKKGINIPTEAKTYNEFCKLIEESENELVKDLKDVNPD